MPIDRSRYTRDIPAEVREKVDKYAVEKIAKEDGPGIIENKLRQAYEAMKLAEAYEAAGNSSRAADFVAKEQRLHDEIADLER